MHNGQPFMLTKVGGTTRQACKMVGFHARLTFCEYQRTPPKRKGMSTTTQNSTETFFKLRTATAFERVKPYPTSCE